jgi:DNA-directed RNA polymerase subunit RPC12/RpoP
MINQNYIYNCKNCDSTKMDSLNPDKELWCGACGQRHEFVNGNLVFYKGVKKNAGAAGKKDIGARKKHKRS